jgi:hypothetical protein
MQLLNQEHTMVKDDTSSLLDAILQDWHRASKSEGLTPERVECVTFAGHASNRGAMLEYEIAEDSIESTRLEAIQFHVDQLSPEHRTALQFEARNLNARLQVWRSPRLPQDPVARQALVDEARAALMRRLVNDGRIL